MTPKTLTVRTASHSYPIHFGDEAVAALRQCVSDLRTADRPLVVFCDEGIYAAQKPFIESAGFTKADLFVLPAGETSKSVSNFGHALGHLARRGMNRDGILFAFGGGVIGDLTGFVAASYLRGVSFHQIPTTLLAMVDSSVGGKTGINLPEGKNLVGAFWQPESVIIDNRLLATLPAREFSSGMAEVIKYGLLDDVAFFEHLETIPRLEPEADELLRIIRHCCSIKARIVEADEKETAVGGGRALLNLGHTFAHAVENVAGYGEYLHGEAVSIGLVLAARLSQELGYINDSDVDRIIRLNTKYDLPSALRKPLDTDRLMTAMRRDKKNRSGQLRFVVMHALGASATESGIDPERIESLWKKAGAR